MEYMAVYMECTLGVVASQNNHKGQIYIYCWSVYEYTPCQLTLLSFAPGYMYRPVQTSRKENDL